MISDDRIFSCFGFDVDDETSACFAIYRAAVLKRDDFHAAAESRAEMYGERFDQRFVSVEKALQSGLVSGLGFGFCGAKHAANDAAGALLGFVELGERGAEA